MQGFGVTMEYLLCGEKSGQKRPEIQRFWWHDMGVRVHLLPVGWKNTGRIRRYVEKHCEKDAPLWISEDAAWAGYRPPLPEVQLALWMLKQQPFRENLVLFLNGKSAGKESLNGKGAGKEALTEGQPSAGGGNPKWWTERFLEGCFEDLNGLYLIGDVGADRTEFFEWMQAKSGLVAVQAQEVPKLDGRRSVLVDLSFGTMPRLQSLSAGLIYLDLTSDPEKSRILKEKRRDISCICARNCLDTAFKARYNVT